MAQQNTSKLWSVLAIAVIGSALLSIVGATNVGAVPRACCFANATCEVLSRSVCEDQQGGISQTIGSNCTVVTCPLLCGGSAPACNGECADVGTICAPVINGTAPGKGILAGVCSCVPEIPQGGSCELQPGACTPGLVCEDGVCCDGPCPLGQSCDLPGHEGVCTAEAAPAPAASNVGLMILVAVLVMVGGTTLLRRRRGS